MSKYELFEFIRDNLTLVVSEREYMDTTDFTFKLELVNPTSQEKEWFSSDTITIKRVI